MSIALERLLDLAPEGVRPLRRAEYERMVEEGSFADERVELIEGVIVEMSPQNPRHAAVVQRLNRHLGRVLAGRADVRIQLPFSASDESQPEPDVAVVPTGDYDSAHPTQAFLVIEVSDASLRKDRHVKGAVYAAAGVPEYWIVNLAQGVIEVHTDPSGGRYARLVPMRPGDTITLRPFPGAEIAVSDILR